MRFNVKSRGKPNYYHKYPKRDIEIARKFTKRIYKEMGDFLVVVALFGSTARGRAKTHHDIDVLVVIDDVHVQMNRALTETYRIIIAKATADIDPKRLHIQSMKLTTFWEYMRSGDPVAINILRDSIALLDVGFFDPLQTLLFMGRIRPASESIWTYYSMSVASQDRAQNHIDMAVIDLYWATIDAAHAALMSLGEIPPSPDHVAGMIKRKMVDTGMLPERYATIMKHMYILSKKISRKEKGNFTGEDYERLLHHVKDFRLQMKKIINKRK
jgi:predicted nucleotidyltransferase/uncharacterized protein (UPF0332 family)